MLQIAHMTRHTIKLTFVNLDKPQAKPRNLRVYVVAPERRSALQFAANVIYPHSRTGALSLAGTSIEKTRAVSAYHVNQCPKCQSGEPHLVQMRFN